MMSKSHSSLGVPSEHDEQVAFMQLAHCFLGNLSPLIYAIPNGGARNIVVATKLKEEGVKSGVPDLCFACPRGEYHGLYIEMKKRKGGRVSDNQKEYIRLLQEQGYFVTVCKGCDEAFEVLKEYMSKGESDAAK